MCNLYSFARSQAEVRATARVMRDGVNVPALPGIYPDYAAPIVRAGEDGVRELAMARWGLPTPKNLLPPSGRDSGVTNVRTTTSPHWRRWLGVANRCLVPFTSFSEPGPAASGKNEPWWFALAEDRPLAFFAGIWVPKWTSIRKVKEGEVTADLFAFLTCSPNAEVGAIHPKAMPVILTHPDELDLWMTAPAMEALRLQRALPDGALQVVGRGGRQDPPGPPPAVQGTLL
nr:SOS response-associated peptidase family protein [uncultured Roseococcus sp.]